MKDLNELQAMNKYLPRHIVVADPCQSSIQMKDRKYAQDLDKLSTYDQDDLHYGKYPYIRNVRVEYNHSYVEKLLKSSEREVSRSM